MKRLTLVGAAMLCLGLGAGCSHIPFIGKKFKHKEAPKMNAKIATETEFEFEQRWVAKRSAELLSQGQTQEAANAQATTEFKKQFPATHPAMAQK